MELNTAYDVVHGNREIQAIDLQESIAYNVNQRSLTQTDNEYSTIENTGYNTAGDTKSTESVLDNKSNTKRIRQEVAKNEYGKKRFAILVIVAFVLSLLVAVAALVYTNIELKNQMISTNKQIQSMNEQLNNQSSQQIQILQAQLSHSILLLQNNFSEQLSSTNKQAQSMNEQLIMNNQSSQQIQILQAQLSHSILLLQNNFSEQLSSTNKQVQSTNEQLNNQSSQLSNSIIDLSSNISEQNKHILRNLNDAQSILKELEPLLYLGTINNPASSCSDIPQDRPSGEYWIATNTTSSPVQVYCDMNGTSCSCNIAGGWMRVANLDMTDPNQNCPDGMRLVTRTTAPLRTCGGQIERQVGCTSTTYSTYGVEYSNVCGRIIAYQSSTPDAFEPYFTNRAASIDDVYVDGVSLTHGQSPRQHIWTFANALDEVRFNGYVCPCTRPDLTYTGVVPPFIGQDYFCETGSRQAFIIGMFYPDDPLWDGQGCGGTSTCCEFNNPPWFCKQLPQPTTDDIELRLCGNQIPDEDSPIEIVEIYIR
ncbi:uncharacterized protein LOC135335723 [Halichondria panicea]|uniref:uncharacterized protein LOC135335723 n=1 Tax=Halichondria panicea TaxID=6063 RepID=UPI00312B8DF5